MCIMGAKNLWYETLLKFESNNILLPREKRLFTMKSN